MNPAPQRAPVRHLETRDEGIEADRLAREAAAQAQALKKPPKPEKPQEPTDPGYGDQPLPTAPAPALIGRAAAGYSIGGRLGELLEPAFLDEPPIDDAAAGIFARAEELRRRRTRIVLAAAVLVVALVFALGYALTSVLLPNTPEHRATLSTGAPASAADPVQTLFAQVLTPSRLRIVPRDPGRGEGWRQYLVLTAAGRSHGLIEVSVYTARKGLCFPVLADRSACARPERASNNVQYARYAFDSDADWQVNEVIARRLPDGRTVAVQSTGERGTGSVLAGRPPLSALLTAKAATDPRLANAFSPHETCNASHSCPLLRVPVPVAG